MDAESELKLYNHVNFLPSTSNSNGNPRKFNRGRAQKPNPKQGSKVNGKKKQNQYKVRVVLTIF